MCRFCVCELPKSELSKRCAYKNGNIEYDVPWSTNNNYSVDYLPSTFIQPRNGLPVIVHGHHFGNPEKRLFHPMYWTLVPSWYDGDLTEWKASCHNARVENLFQNRMYNTVLNEGKRCIVVMDGFFEYKKINNFLGTEVYYLRSSQDNTVLKAAGLFSITKRYNGETLYSCTVITTEANSFCQYVHSRVPLLLNDDNTIEAWLNYESISSKDAVSEIQKSNKAQDNLVYYRTKKVGSVEPICQKAPLASKSFMSSWLKSGNRKRKAED